MTTHKTLAAARAAVRDDYRVTHVIEIDHATEGRVYIGATGPMAMLADALKRKPMAEITTLVSEHSKYSAQEIEAFIAANPSHCERCGVVVPADAYKQKEPSYLGGKRITVIAHYCKGCATLLRAVGKGEHTAMQDRASAGDNYEMPNKQD